MKPEIFWLAATAIMTGLFFLPYVLDRMMVLGIMGTLKNPGDHDKPLHPWAQRAKRAHYNAVENLVVFAALVAAAQFAGVSTELTAWGCMLYFWARLAHYVVYTLGIPVLRTLCFFAGFIGEVMIAVALLHAM
ncbi:MAG: MAPEG family protein [Gammaproteobacteria bacterium]